MVAYNIRYLDKNNIRLHQEGIYMKGVSGAKQSATALSPLNTESIEIRDILNNIVAKTQKGKWVNLADEHAASPQHSIENVPC